MLTVDQRRWLDLKGRIKLAQPLHIPPRPGMFLLASNILLSQQSHMNTTSTCTHHLDPGNYTWHVCNMSTVHIPLFLIPSSLWKKNATRFYLKIYHIAVQVDKIVKVRSTAINVFFVRRRNKLPSQDVRHHAAQEVQGWHSVLDSDQLCSAGGPGECLM